MKLWILYPRQTNFPIPFERVADVLAYVHRHDITFFHLESMDPTPKRAPKPARVH